MITLQRSLSDHLKAAAEEEARKAQERAEQPEGRVNRFPDEIRTLIADNGRVGENRNNRHRERKDEGDRTPRGGGNCGRNWRFRKLDMPVYEGDDPDGWILRVERYFNFHKLDAEEQMDSAVVAMEGDALRFFQWKNCRRPIEGWR